jgi:protein-S-isoprenylcysteine O-methyltransferase Ste14
LCLDRVLDLLARVRGRQQAERQRRVAHTADWRQRGRSIRDRRAGLIVVAVLVAYFYYCGTVEERNLAATFPTAYPEYQSRTKMLIPFLL